MAHQYFKSEIDDDSMAIKIQMKYRGTTVSLKQECGSLEDCKAAIISSMNTYLQNEADDFIISAISAKGGNVHAWIDHPVWEKLSAMYSSSNLRDLPSEVIRCYKELEGLIPRDLDPRNGRPKSPQYFLLYEHLNWLRDFSMNIIELCNRVHRVELVS